MNDHVKCFKLSLLNLMRIIDKASTMPPFKSDQLYKQLHEKCVIFISLCSGNTLTDSNYLNIAYRVRSIVMEYDIDKLVEKKDVESLCVFDPFKSKGELSTFYNTMKITADDYAAIKHLMRNMNPQLQEYAWKYMNNIVKSVIDLGEG